MLPAPNRLIQTGDFQYVLKKGRSGWGNLLTVKYRLVKPKQDSKFGFIVSTKVSKLATKRNYLKRILRENIRTEFLPKLKKPIWAVIIAKKEIVDKNYQDIKKDITYILKKQRLIWKPSTKFSIFSPY